MKKHPAFFFFNDTATTEIYTLSLHDALPISDKITRTICGTPVHHASAASTSLTRRSGDAGGPGIDGGALTSTQTQSSSTPSLCTVTVVTHSPADESSVSRYRSEREPSCGCSSVTTRWACSATS